MGKNLVIVGLDRPFLEQFASQLACKIDYIYIDILARLDQELISSIDMPLDIGEPYIQARERELYYTFNDSQNAITVITDDMYAANENYQIFENCFVLYVTNDKSDKTLEKLLKKHVDLIIKQENLKVKGIVDIFKG